MMSMRDPLAPYGRNDPCWCGSGEKYKACHGDGPRWPPGAPIPADRSDDEKSIQIAPDVTMSRDAMNDLTRQMAGAPIHMPSSEPQPEPLRVTEFSARLAATEPLVPSVSLAELGCQRFAVLEDLGLVNPDSLGSRLASLTDDDFDALIHATFSTAKGMLDRLLEQAAQPDRPTALWAETSDVPLMVAQTLFWADHYLAPDELAQGLLRSPDVKEAPRLESALRQLLKLRPLIELGVVGLVLDEALAVLTAEGTEVATAADLENTNLFSWLVSQMEIEGPTAREVLFVNAKDHFDAGPMYFLGHFEPGQDADPGLFTSKSLQNYDPSRDYSAWIEQSRQKTAVGFLQDMNRQLAIAQALGADFLAGSPFQGRLLRRKAHPTASAEALLWADVPILLGSSPTALARVAAEDEAVAALRAVVRRAFRVARSEDSAVRLGAAAGLVEDLDEQAERLRRSIERDRAWKLTVPLVLGASSIAIGSVLFGPVSVPPAVLSTLGSLSPYIADMKTRKENPGYALLLARV